MWYLYLKKLYCGDCNVIIFRYLDNWQSISLLEFDDEASKSFFFTANFFSRCFSRTKYLNICIYTTVSLSLVYSIWWKTQNLYASNTSYIFFTTIQYARSFNGLLEQLRQIWFCFNKDICIYIHIHIYIYIYIYTRI